MRAWILYTSFATLGLAAFQTSDHSLGEFAGRISKLNAPAGLLRIRIQFSNLRYLNRGDRVKFKTGMGSTHTCQAVIKGKSNDYLLIQVPFFARCHKYLHFTVGSYLHFHSQDLIKNIEQGKEVIGILLKKRIALDARKRSFQKDLEVYEKKVQTTNDRYQVLMEKMAKEQRQVLRALADDNSLALKNIAEVEDRINKVDYKLEQYKVSDQNLELDRWSLDHRLYFKK